MTTKDRWKNRRRMAWIAFLAGVLYPLLALVSDDSKVLVELSAPLYLFLGSVVGAYIGFSTYDDKWNREDKGWENM